METKEKFKDFVKNHPILLNHVKDGKMTWQKFYEMYDMYGEDNEVWNEYLALTATTAAAATSSFDIMSFLKGLDLDNVQEGISSMQRVLGLLQDMSGTKTTQNDTKKPRPLYKHFED